MSLIILQDPSRVGREIWIDYEMNLRHMDISIIAALSSNRVIGKNNDLPWKLPHDMKYFMNTTKGHTVVMGRKNYESIPEKYRPLQNRENIVITRQKDYNAQGCIVIDPNKDIFGELFSLLRHKKSFIIGGGEIYKLCLPFVSKLYLTEIKAEIEGDVFFPEIDMSKWKEISRVPHGIDEKHKYEFDFVVYEKIWDK